MSLFTWLFGNRNSDEMGSASASLPIPYHSTSRARVKWREGSFPMNAVGESNYQAALERICAGHNRYGHELETDADLVREPSNPYDSNAIAVMISGNTVGYLPRDQASRVAAQMAEDGIGRAACRARIVGGWRTNQYDEGSFGVRLAVPCWDWIDFGLGKQAPVCPEKKTQPERRDKPTRPEAAETGPLKGQWVVIWGASDHGEVAHELANLGAHIMAGVGKSTTLVIQIDDELTPGMAGSSTYQKAQQRIAEGANLEVVTLNALRMRLV